LIRKETSAEIRDALETSSESNGRAGESEKLKMIQEVVAAPAVMETMM
jgi:hypothetical protein